MGEDEIVNDENIKEKIENEDADVGLISNRGKTRKFKY